MPFAVVELFASEGCSSCPPADEVLRGLAPQARSQGKRIFTLSFEVDYWNYLGWQDPFSQPQFSQRQQQYADALAASTYTPQMVINGTHAFVGSDAAKANTYINQYLQAPVADSLHIEIKNNGPQSFDIAFRGHAADPAVLNLAVVEKETESHVTAGENAGRTLRHANVVRVFKSIPLAQQGTVSVEKPATFTSGRFSLIAYVQNAARRNITAAQSIDL